MAFPGGKGKSFQHIINHMPPHKLYVEPFVGSGAVVANKKPAHKTIINDINPKFVSELNLEIDGLEAYVGDALDVLSLDIYNHETLVYCDPPYVPEVRRKTKIYEYEFDLEQHKTLLRKLKSLDCMVLLSGYDNALYNAELVGWNKYCYTAQSQVGPRTETLWFNYSLSGELHDTRYLGKNFRERQNIKRRLSRMKDKFKAMPPCERLELMDWLQQTYAR